MDAEILALRLYTTKAYPLINNLLRQDMPSNINRTVKFDGKKLGLTLNSVTGDKTSGEGIRIIKVKKDAPDETINQLIFPGSVITAINGKDCRRSFKYQDLLNQIKQGLAATEPLVLKL